jgi:hypothetical protein
MLTVARHSLPWGRLAAAATLFGILLEAVRRWPWNVWPLEGIAVGLLAVAAAWCMDEPAGAVIDVVPRSLWWRTAARATGVMALTAVWSVAVWWSREGLFGHSWEVWSQGMVGATVGAVWATWRRSSGVRTPGVAFAAAVIPTAALWALVRPFAESFPVFPYASRGFGNWTTSTAVWLTVGAVALLALPLTLSDAQWWRLERVLPGAAFSNRHRH